ncbi:hypothetical protein [Mycobacterium nebraskense]|uniref:hypothetical protein n=1 Tax=Mycobacterium nebraskense TaxID=244292 RepID=UPI0023F3F374|nr:hypothetical protein [Mycobacterium nebraskense]MBI2692976.1 hypothetical protein [Mycobacterium nebraskense]
MAMKFLSDEWCAAAMKAINNNDAVYKGFKDPESFSYAMYFGLIDKPEVTTYFTFDKGKLTAWTTEKIHGDGPFDFGLRAKAEHFRMAAEGKQEPAKMLLGGLLRITDGELALAIENAEAFDHFLLSFAQVDTDWDV